MQYGYGILSPAYELWMKLKDHLSYFVTTCQQSYILAIIGAR